MRRAASVERRPADFSIAELRSGGDLEKCARVIRGAFATVAEDLHLTRENAPTHPSFIRLEKVRSSFLSGVAYFGLRLRGRMIGCVAVEKAENRCYIERLSVLPGFRRRGYGLSLVEHAIGYARNAGAARASVGIIDTQRTLRDWYVSMGFEVKELRAYDHLPFTVCIMEKEI
jgi:ribosomal protein S18 acetylase RimI-like enzyme